MIDSAEYTPDGKFLVLNSTYGKEETDLKVPVALIDELIERRLSAYDVERLLFVRHLTAGYSTRKVPISELVGEDLTGKTVGVYFRNYEDSEWLNSSNVISVAKQEGSIYEATTYEFVFPEVWAKCGEECGHDLDLDECPYDDLVGVSFHGNATILITEEETVNA